MGLLDESRSGLRKLYLEKPIYFYLREDNPPMKKFSLFVFGLLILGIAHAQDPQLDAVKIKIDAKNFEGAKTDLKKIIDASPKNKQAFNMRGLARTGLNDFYGAIGDYNMALEIDSTFAETWNNRGEAKMALGDDDAAIQDFDKSIKFNAKFTNAYTNRGLAKFNIEDLKGAYFVKH